MNVANWKEFLPEKIVTFMEQKVCLVLRLFRPVLEEGIANCVRQILCIGVTIPKNLIEGIESFSFYSGEASGENHIFFVE